MTNIVEIRKATTSNQTNALVLQSEQDAKRVDLHNRLASLNARIKVATRSISKLEEERSTFNFRFKFR